MDSQIFNTILDSFLGFLGAIAVTSFVAWIGKTGRIMTAEFNIERELERIRENLIRWRETGDIEPFDTPIWDSVISTGDILLMRKSTWWLSLRKTMRIFWQKMVKRTNGNQEIEYSYGIWLELYEKIHKVKMLNEKYSEENTAEIKVLIDEIERIFKKNAAEGKEDWSMLDVLKDKFKTEDIDDIHVTMGEIKFTTKNLRNIVPPPSKENEPYFAVYDINRRTNQKVSLKLWMNMTDPSNLEAKKTLLSKYNQYLRLDKPEKTGFREQMSVRIKGSQYTRDNITKEEFEKIIKAGVDYDKELGKKLKAYDKRK